MESNSDVLGETTSANPSFFENSCPGNHCFSQTTDNGDWTEIEGFASSQLGRFFDDNKEFTKSVKNLPPLSSKTVDDHLIRGTSTMMASSTISQAYCNKDMVIDCGQKDM